MFCFCDLVKLIAFKFDSLYAFFTLGSIWMEPLCSAPDFGRCLMLDFLCWELRVAIGSSVYLFKFVKHMTIKRKEECQSLGKG